MRGDGGRGGGGEFDVHLRVNALRQPLEGRSDI